MSDDLMKAVLSGLVKAVLNDLQLAMSTGLLNLTSGLEVAAHMPHMHVVSFLLFRSPKMELQNGPNVVANSWSAYDVVLHPFDTDCSTCSDFPASSHE